MMAPSTEGVGVEDFVHTPKKLGQKTTAMAVQNGLL